MRLQGALDNDINVAVQRFLADGVPADVNQLYTALQRSNSALKRRPKKVLIASIERVLEFIGVTAQEDPAFDSDAEIERAEAAAEAAKVADLMNKSLRANLAPIPAAPAMPILEHGGEEDASQRRLANGESLPKRAKRGHDEKISTAVPQGISFDDLGGMAEIKRLITDKVILPLISIDDFRKMRIPISKGIMLHGPPGCGKTMLVRATAAELGLPFLEILGPSVVSGVSGQSEKSIREKFEEAKKHAPCLIFIDEVDAIAPKREHSQGQMEKRIVAQLLVSMDEVQRDDSKPVIIMAATNRPDSIDPALRRAGRFGTEISIPVPDAKVRRLILNTLLEHSYVNKDVDTEALSHMTAGFVGADLKDLVTQATSEQVARYKQARLSLADRHNLYSPRPKSDPETNEMRKLIACRNRSDPLQLAESEEPSLAMADFLAVLPKITPSSKREGFATVPNVSWKDIGALHAIRKELQDLIVHPIRHAKSYLPFGPMKPSGVLLWGPPGCGKTLLAKATAAESKANFISIKGPELLNKFVGESEAAVRKVFSRARSSVPCVIFIDELDALVPRRDGSGSEVSSRLVNTLLTELDGLEVRSDIYVIGATNRADVIDEAMLRPGRLGKSLFVDLPGPEERVEILRTLLATRPCKVTEAIEELARKADGLSGADLEALISGAINHAIDRESTVLELQDFLKAMTTLTPSVKDPNYYRNLEKRLTGDRFAAYAGIAL